MYIHTHTYLYMRIYYRYKHTEKYTWRICNLKNYYQVNTSTETSPWSRSKSTSTSQPPSRYCAQSVLSHSGASNSLWPHELQPARRLCPGGFSRQEYWDGLPCPPLGDRSNPALPHCRRIRYRLSHQGSPSCCFPITVLLSSLVMTRILTSTS